MTKTILAIGALIACAHARAVTLELNPNAQFDADVAGLELFAAPAGGALHWSPLDLTGRIPGGSARLSGPAGAYRLATCGLVPFELPFARYDFAASVRLRSPDGPAIVFGELIPMFGGDSLLDGPCRRPLAGYASAYGFPAPDADLGIHIRNAWPPSDVGFWLVIQKPDGDVLLDGLSLTIDSDPIATDGFE